MRIIFTRFLILMCFLLSFSTSVFAEQLKFVQVTDVHLSLNGSNYQGRDLEHSLKILQTAIESINKLQDINFVVFSGDNIDTSNRDDLVKFLETVKTLNKPYYISIGDHDIFKSGGLTKSEYIETVKKYNKNQKSNDTYYYFFPNKDFIVIVMDGVLSGTITSSHGGYSEEDLEWLDEVLTKNNNKKAIIVQHFPLIEPYESKTHRVRNPEEYFNLLSNHKNVIALISGHYHGGDKVTLQDEIYHISSPALVNSPDNKYRIIEINYDHDSLFQETPKFDLKTDIILLKP